ncbi:MAG TPA: DinB family protein, partial [Acidobacteriaceae bacterium]|nr:DinB family protein [Acidobacteriaceae bacterium]
ELEVERMAKTDDAALREQLVALLKGGHAHVTLADAVAQFPADRIGERPHDLPYSAWQLVEHIRITLHDLLEFATNSEYVELDWPGGYWPKNAVPGKDESWNATLKALQADMKSFEALVHSPDSNLYATIPWGKNGETLLREVLLAADHTSYHVGELVLLRRVLGIWKS